MLEQNPLVIKVKEIAQQEPHSTEDNLIPDYNLGYSDGRIHLAREILDTLGIKY